MSYTVYALRLRGDDEVRYIGQTTDKPIVRLAGHIVMATSGTRNTSFGEWIIANVENIEAIALSVHDTLADARIAERAAIEAHSELQHRLFNIRLLPTAHRATSAKQAT